MGAFLLTRDGIAEDPPALFAEKGLAENSRWQLPGWTLWLFQRADRPSLQVVHDDAGRFLAVVGPAFYEGLGDESALRRLLEALGDDATATTRLTGQFAMVHSDGHRVRLLTDLAGYVWIFGNSEETVFSTSMRAVVEQVGSPTFRKQEVFEYLMYQAPLGGHTVVDQVSVMDSRQVHVLSPEGTRHGEPRALPAQPSTEAGEWLHQVADNVLGYFETLVQRYGAGIGAGMSGGFDSRLILSVLRKIGVRPYLYTYGSADSTDVAITRAIARGEGIEIEHIDRSTWPRLEPEAFAAQVERHFAFFEVMAVEGIFKDASDLDTRLDRTHKAELLLHGGGAEMYRNRWALPDHRFTLDQIIAAQFDNFDPGPLVGFDRRQFFTAIKSKIEGTLGRQVDRVDHRDLTLVYGLLTEKYGVGHNNCVNNQLGHALMPFMDHPLLWQASRIPHALKFAARLNRDLIRSFDEKLAAYPTQYGFDFASPLPARNRLKYWLIDHTPIGLRGPIRRRNLQQNVLYRRGRRAREFPYYLEPRYVEAVLAPGPLAVAEYVDVSRIQDPAMLSRAYTLEILMRRYG